MIWRVYPNTRFYTFQVVILKISEASTSYGEPKPFEASRSLFGYDSLEKFWSWRWVLWLKAGDCKVGGNNQRVLQVEEKGLGRIIFLGFSYIPGTLNDNFYISGCFSKMIPSLYVKNGSLEYQVWPKNPGWNPEAILFLEWDVSTVNPTLGSLVLGF